MQLWWREVIFKSTIGNESLHQDSNGNGVRIASFVTSKHLVVKSTMFQHRNIHKYTWTPPDGKTHTHVDHIWIDRRHSSVLDYSLSGVPTVIMITNRWLQKLGKIGSK